MGEYIAVAPSLEQNFEIRFPEKMIYFVAWLNDW
jgi:hypothetical protein